MNKPVKTKLCWNCEGSVARTAENCPFCGVYLSPETKENESLGSASIKPPYLQGRDEEREIPKAPYRSEESESIEEDPEEAVSGGKEGTLSKVSPSLMPKALLLSLASFATGIVFLFFALILLFFSENGKLTLEWDAEAWYLYLVIGVPLLLLSWKFLGQIQEE